MLDFGNLSAMPVKDMKSDESLGQKGSSRRCSGDLKGTGGCPMGLMGPGGDELMLEVTCGQNQAALYMSRLQLGSKGTCVLFENSWLTPNEFQYISGRETAKDWKRSIKHHGKSLKVLISKGILATSPLRCNCGQCAQSKEKDVFKYIVTDDVKMTPASTLRDVFTTDPSKLVKSERTKDAVDRKSFGAPGESNENKKDVTSDTLQRPSAEYCLTSHSQGGARLASLCDKSVYTAGPTKDCCFRSKVDDAYRVEQSCHLANKTNNKMSCEDTDSKLKTKKRMEVNENEELLKDGSRLGQDGEQRKLGTESIKSSVAESPAAGGTLQKRSASSGNKLASGAAGEWSQNTANYSTYQSESTASKSSPHDKTRKLTSSSHLVPSSTADKPTCSQVNASSSGKTLLPDTGVSVPNPARPSPSESSFVFPSFGSPYYPMIPAPQLPAYYANPYMWPMPFAANPSTCTYGWTEPSEIAAVSRLLSPAKDSLECSMANIDQAFNFPWMKRLNCSGTDRETTNETGSSSGKRKLDCDPAEYLLPSKQRLYLADSLRSTYGDAVGWPGYTPNAASAINFRFLPYNIPSYIPDVRPTHGLFAGNFVKGCESPSSSGLGLFPSLFPSQCLGVNSR